MGGRWFFAGCCVLAFGLGQLIEFHRAEALTEWGAVRAALIDMIDPATGRIVRLSFLCKDEQRECDGDAVCQFCNKSGVMKLARLGGEAEDFSSSPGSGGTIYPDSTTVGCIPQFSTDRGNAVSQSNICQNGDGSVTITGDVNVVGKIRNDGPSGFAQRKYDAGKNDPALCANLVNPDGFLSVIDPALGKHALCDGTTEVPLGTTTVSWSNGTWVDDNCWKPDQSFGADATCTSNGTELNRAPANMFAMRWCVAINDPDTSMPVGEGSDIELFINSVVIDTIELGKVDSFDGQGETLCKNLTTPVASGVRVQIRTQANAATCETGSGCVLPTTALAEASLFWRFAE